MNEQTVLETLRGVEFFDNVEEQHLERLAALPARPVEFAPHTNIFQEHEQAKDVYLIVSGRVSLIICTPKVACRQLMEVSDGELIGWSPLVGRPRLYDTARTLTPTTAIALDSEQLLAFCPGTPDFGYVFMHRTAMVLAQRLSATRLHMLDMSGVRLPRVAIESD